MVLQSTASNLTSITQKQARKPTKKEKKRKEKKKHRIPINQTLIKD